MLSNCHDGQILYTFYIRFVYCFLWGFWWVKVVVCVEFKSAMVADFQLFICIHKTLYEF